MHKKDKDKVHKRGSANIHKNVLRPGNNGRHGGAGITMQGHHQRTVMVDLYGKKQEEDKD